MFLNLRYSHGRNRVRHRSPEFNIDVPSEYWEISNYRATLGHKANHSFLKSNAKYVSVIHPRHGPISAVVSNERSRKERKFYAHMAIRQTGRFLAGMQILTTTNSKNIGLENTFMMSFLMM